MFVLALLPPPLDFPVSGPLVLCTCSGSPNRPSTLVAGRDAVWRTGTAAGPQPALAVLSLLSFQFIQFISHFSELIFSGSGDVRPSASGGG